MNITKTITAVMLLAITLVTLLTGCTRGSGVTLNSIESNTSGKISMDYTKFTGFREKTVDFKEENLPLDIKVEVETERGSLDLYIARDNEIETAVYEGHDIPTMNFTVTVTEPGSYTIRVDADDHSGSYLIQWDN